MDRVYDFDLTLFRAINSGWHSPILDPIFYVITNSGLGQCVVVATLLLAISKSTRPYVLPMLVELLLGGLILGQGTKSLMDRDRPSNLQGAFVHEPYYHTSFPSSHTSLSFSAATMLLLLTWNTPKKKWGWLAMVWATLVGISRIYEGVHWPTDVAAGALIGIASASLVFLVYRSISEGRIVRKNS